MSNLDPQKTRASQPAPAPPTTPAAGVPGQGSSSPRQTFLESLLQDVPDWSPESFKEYRAVLTDNLQTAERKYKFRRKVTIVIWGIIGGLALIGALLTSYGGLQLKPFGATFIVVAYLLGFLGLLRLAMFIFVDRYRLETVRNEVRDATLLELTRKIEALSRSDSGKA